MRMNEETFFKKIATTILSSSSRSQPWLGTLKNQATNLCTGM